MRRPKKQKTPPKKNRTSSRGRSPTAKENRSGSERGGRQRSRGRGQTTSYIGRIQKNPRGFAFVIPREPGVPDAYIAKNEAEFLMNDDTVEYVLHRSGKRYSAEIKRIVERGQKEIVAKIVRDTSGKKLFLETAQGEPLRLQNPENQRPGEWVLAEIEEYPSAQGSGSALIVEKFGTQLLPKHDYQIAIARFGLPSFFDERTQRQASEAKRRMDQADLTYRKDLRELPFVTIDGEDAKDFDDAVLVTAGTGDAAFILYVAIADVSFFVVEGSPLDISARQRGTSVYFPGFCLPMLPEALSNDLCSLRPREERFALTAEIHLDREGDILRSKFYESTIRTAARVTYTELQAFYDRKADMRQKYAALEKPFSLLLTLFHKRLEQRKRRGVLDFDLPECKMTLDAEGNPISMGPAPRYDSHRLIEEFMIAANSEVARALREGHVEALYRVHETPEASCLDDINFLLRNLGISKKINQVSPIAISKVLESTHGIKGAQTLHQAILRLQKQARYEPEPRGHFGLALKDYTHFTSPIRRYPDLVVHRALKTLISRERPSDKEKERERMTTIGLETSARERKAMEAERFVVKRKQCWFMRQHIGETFSGDVTGITARGLYASIPQFALDGFLALEELDGYYEFDEDGACLRQRPGHSTLSVGDSITFQVANVYVEDNEILFTQKRPS